MRRSTAPRATLPIQKSYYSRVLTVTFLKKALQGLPPEFREVVIMREVEGLSYREIASISGVPLGTVMSRLARARTRLQQVLARPIEQAGPTTT